MIEARGTDTAEVVQVIKTTALFGAGTTASPAMEITQYWTLDGKLLATVKPSIGEAQ